MSDVTSRTPPASENEVTVSSDQLTAATRLGPDQGGSQAQTNRDAQLVVSQLKPK